MRNRKDKFFSRVSLIVGLLVVVATGIPLRAQTDVRYGVAVSKDVMVAMRDGVKLAADIYRPTQNGQLVDGKFPVLLVRTPYNKDDSAQSANSFVSHGYVVVLQDVRGRYKSEGHWRPHFDDPNDGFDTAQWIGSQPWLRWWHRHDRLVVWRCYATLARHWQRSLHQGHGSPQRNVGLRALRRSP